MTLPRPLLAAELSVNELFKLRRPRYLKGALLAALALTALFVWLWPGYRPQPYQLRQDEILTLIEIAPAVPVVEPPQPIEAPRLPPIVEPAADDDPNAQDTIPEPLPIETPFKDVQPLPGGDEGFVASSTMPALRFQAKPDYPEIARRAGLEGTVLVRVLVDETGQVKRAEVIQGVHPLLDRSAVAAALRCRFAPGLQRGMPVVVSVAVPYRFRLK